MLATPLRANVAGFVSKRTKSELSAGKANEIAIIEPPWLTDSKAAALG